VKRESHDQIAVFRISADNASTIAETAKVAGAAWMLLGDEILVSGRPADVERAVAEMANVVAPRVHTTVASERLQLVTQNGRLFQQEQSDVPVIVDKGRYLVVDLDPGEAKKLNVPYMPCYSLQPLPWNTVVLETRAPVAARRAPLVWVQQCVDALSRTTFEADLRALTAFPTRHSTSAEFVAAAQWARDQLSASGYNTRTQTVPVSGVSSVNVIAERQGSGSTPRDVVVVTAHLDSVNIAGGVAAPAPGADDNGSGSAGLLAIARAMKDQPAVHDLRLILFGGEEQGLFGSRQYVASLPRAQRDRIRAVVNMDMIGTLNSPSPTVLLEGGKGVSQAVIDGLAEAAATYTTLTVQTSLHPFNSDHVPFIQEGIAAVLTIEGTDAANGNIHGANDTLQFIDYDLALDILRMNVAFVAQLLGNG
jgi:Peptidase family M28